MVNFRLSDDEYRELEQACRITGAHSISDFARSAVLQLVAEEQGIAPIRARGRLATRVETMLRELRELSDWLHERGRCRRA